MDGKQYGEPDIEHARERIEAKRDEFAGGPEPGWEQMEQAATEARQEAADQTDVTASPVQEAAQPARDAPQATPEHPAGVGKQCAMCGAYNDFDATTCWQCSRELAGDQTSV